MNLTITKQSSIISTLLEKSSIALAKSSAEIDTSNSTGVISTPIRKCFFYVRYMVGCMRHLSGWRFPVDRSINLVQPITNQIDTCGDSSKTITTGDNQMSKNKTPGQNCPSKSPSKSKELSDLPFFSSGYQPAIYWRADISGDYAQQCARGVVYADAAMDHINQTNLTPLLGWIIRDMITVGNFTGVEVGFCNQISTYAAAHYKVAKLVEQVQEQRV